MSKDRKKVISVIKPQEKYSKGERLTKEKDRRRNKKEDRELIIQICAREFDIVLNNFLF